MRNYHLDREKLIKTRLIRFLYIFLIILGTQFIPLSSSISWAETEQGVAPIPQPASPQIQTETQKLQQQKLVQEIKKLEQETLKLKKETENLKKSFWDDYSSLVTTIASLANALTAIVAIIAAYFTIQKQLEETRVEKARQVDARFTSIVQDFGSDKSEIKASATVSLLTFLEKEYDKYHEQVYMIILANLKIDSKDLTINKLLVKTFEQVIAVYLQNSLINLTEAERSFQLDLSGCHINGITLANLTFNKVNLSYAKLNNAVLEKISLTEANLKNADLTCAYLKEANFDRADLQEAIFGNAQNKSKLDSGTEIIKSTFKNATLISAKLKKVKITDTDFDEAKLQEVHLDGAILKNVKFTKANLNTAFFKGASFQEVDFSQANLKKANFQGAEFDEITLNSILQADYWIDAEFDNDIKQKLNDKIKQP